MSDMKFLYVFLVVLLRWKNTYGGGENKGIKGGFQVKGSFGFQGGWGVKHGGRGAHTKDRINLNGRCNVMQAPQASRLKCITSMEKMVCRAICQEGFFFPDGSRELQYECTTADGVWSPDNRFPDCAPACNPVCQNGGECVGPNNCMCPKGFRGNVCQYLNSLCNPQAKGFQGSFKCIHGPSGSNCDLQCIPGMQMEPPNSGNVHCSIDGIWTPPSLPRCIFHESPNNHNEQDPSSHSDQTQEIISLGNITQFMNGSHQYREDRNGKPSEIPTNRQQQTIDNNQKKEVTKEQSTVCDPVCQNGGECISHNRCLCPKEFRGNVCQYLTSLCDPKGLKGFQGFGRCTHTHNGSECVLNCPPGMEFETPLSENVHCSVDGLWTPALIPQCIMSGVVTNADIVDIDIPGPSPGGYSSYDQQDNLPTQQQYSITESPYPEHEDIHVQPRSSGVCSIWSPFHYRTFDGQLFRFPGTCSYVLVQNCNGMMFSIKWQPQTTCDTYKDCPRDILIEVAGTVYTVNLRPHMEPLISTTGRNLTIPCSHETIRIDREGDYVALRSNIGFSVLVDRQGSISVSIDDVSLMGDVCGLCGFYDGQVANDFRTPDGTIVADPILFGNSWTISNNADCANVIEDKPPCSSETQNQNITSTPISPCSVLFSTSFEGCHELVLQHPYFDACQSDCCVRNSEKECECHAISQYISECVRLGGRLPTTWGQDPYLCPSFALTRCENGMVYEACGSACTATCSNPSQVCANKACVSGCHCPRNTVQHEGKCISVEDCPCTHQNREYQSGQEIENDCNTCVCEKGEWHCTDIPCSARCVLSGHSHFTTFDGLQYDFVGHCSYYLVQHPDFSIIQENGDCHEFMTTTKMTGFAAVRKPDPCMQSLIIRNERGTEVKIRKNAEVLVNGQEVVELPVSVPGMYISQPSSLFLEVILTNGIGVVWDGSHLLFIDASPNLFSSGMMGLCGTYNRNQADEFLTPEGDVESSPIEFGNRWKLLDMCPDVPPKYDGTTLCDIEPDRRASVAGHCSKLTSTIFESCHDLVDVLPYYQTCMSDLCYCKSSLEHCLCPSYAGYAVACARKGLTIDWRSKIPECSVQCTGDLVYHTCVPNCEYSCLEISTRPKCDETRCIEGCACPEGMTLNHDRMCIPISQCPCIYKGREHQPGFKQLQGNQTCECLKGQWNCRPATSEELTLIPTQEEDHLICREKDHQEYTDCLSECPVTCHTMHESSSACVTSICKPGCRCKDGYVLETYNGKCVLPKECPCQHGGKNYKEGDRIKEHCNECTCSGSHWKCERNDCEGVCSAWGEAHYKTFDGRFFSFIGECDYILSRGETDNGEVVTVIVQNVLCGSAGNTCSKSIVFTIGEERIQLMRDRPIRSTSKSTLSTFTMEEFGMFMVVRSKIGITLLWDKRTRVHLKVDSVWRGKLRGLCGNFNGDPQDDFKIGNGGLAVVNPVEFANSWKVQEFCPSPRQVGEACRRQPEREISATKKCSIIKSDLFESCHTEVPPESYYQSCVFDACSCEFGGECECLCTAIAAYAHECAVHGVPILWRSQELCPIQCDKDCDHYSACINQCPKETCEDLKKGNKGKQSSCMSEFCVEGCDKKACPPGQIYNNPVEFKCIPLEECYNEIPPPGSCVLHGIVYKNGQRITNQSFANECLACHCRNGVIDCSGHPCTTLPPTTTKTSDSFTRTCQHGWTEWMNSVKPSFQTGGDFEETAENGFSALRLKYPNLCPLRNMTKIECRQAISGLPYYQSNQDVLCELPKGLLCHNRNQKNHACLDYEIRVFCDCGVQEPVTPEQETVAPSCTPGTEWDPCAYRCDRVCHSFHSRLIDEGHCSYQLDARTYSCVGDCRHITCDPPRVMRDEYTCVMPHECTCTSDDGKILAPGEVVVKDCEKCQCLNNALVCSLMIGCAKPVTEPTIECCDCWTNWINSDTPDDAGDFEDLPKIRSLYSVCASPTAIECRVAQTKQDYKDTNYLVKCEPDKGLRCWNNIQGIQGCVDFEVRFFCPCESTTIAIPIVPSSLETFNPAPECFPGWTPWFNAHKPNEFGEYEDLQAIRSRYHDICPSDLTAVECRVAKNGIPYQEAGQRGVICELEIGLYCENGLQYKGETCYDYEVRFYCACLPTRNVLNPTQSPEPFSNPEMAETVSTELPKPDINPTPCEYWSEWINNDKPWGKHNGGDQEYVSPDVLVSQGFCPEGRITAIDCRDESNRDYRNTGEVGLICSLEKGFVCSNTIQPDHLCLDYKIRYQCNCSQEVIVVPTHSPSVLPHCEEFHTLIDGPYSLTDAQIKASSYFSPSSGPENVRMSTLPGPNSLGAWIPEKLDRNQFVEFDLGTPQALYGIITLGRADVSEWVTSYFVLYSLDGNRFSYYQNPDGTPKVVRGNFDGTTKINRIFDYPFEARFVRIQPLTWNGQIALRADLLGCAKEITSTPTAYTTVTIPHAEVCTDYMGLDNGKLNEDQITFSSQKPPSNGFSSLKLNGIGWTPKEADHKQFVQIDFLKPRTLSGIITKGQRDLPMWVTAYMIEYSQDGSTWNPLRDESGNLEKRTKRSEASTHQDLVSPDFHSRNQIPGKVFPGNFDSDTPVTNRFPKLLRTRMLRIIPTKWRNWIALRMEVLGCYEPYFPPSPTIADFTVTVNPIPDFILCKEPMGFQNGQITDRMIEATSFAIGSSPSQVRLNAKSSLGKFGGWVPEEGALTHQNQYLIINLLHPRMLTGIVTQGREDFDYWVTSFNVLVSNDTRYWITVEGPTGEELRGNDDRDTPNQIFFKTPITGQYVKVVPLTWHQGIGLRMELLGCFHPYQERVEGQNITYSTPSSQVTTTERCIAAGPWLSLSVPSPDNEGDFEPIIEVVKASHLCDNPVAIECRTYTTKHDYQSTNQNVTCDLTRGLVCRNADQKLFMNCYNYEVRIKCWTCGANETTTTNSITSVPICPEMIRELAENCPTSCPDGLVCDGERCIDPVDCPCFIDGKKFQAGDVLEDAKCRRCVCAIDGYSSCVKKECPPCVLGQKSVFSSDCSCLCESCADGRKLCPTSGECILEQQWCDGIVDCPDDETDCGRRPINKTVCPSLKYSSCRKGGELKIYQPKGSPCPRYYCTSSKPLNNDKAICEILSQQYIKTFDGQYVEYEMCDHIVFHDVSKQNRFNAIIRKQCSSPGLFPCKKVLEIQSGAHNVIVGTDLVVMLNGHRYSTHQLTRLRKTWLGFDIAVIGNQMIFKSLDYKYQIKWDVNANLHIEVDSDLLDQVTGSCGFYNKDMTDEKSKPDGSLAFTTREFVDSWKTSQDVQCLNTCPSTILMASTALKSVQECELLRAPPFDQCEGLIDAELYFSACTSFMCECLQDNTTTLSECKCAAFLPLVQECEKLLGKELRGWRILHSCAPVCPPGLEWNDCGPSCDVSCQHSDILQEECQEECVPGCFCPAGQVRDGDICKPLEKCSDSVCEGYGDPFIQTYDGWSLSFQAKGKFVLTRNREKGFEVFAITDLCSEMKDKLGCIVGLDVVYQSNTLKIRKGNPVQLNGVVIPSEALPVEEHRMIVYGLPVQTFVVIIPDISVQVRYFEINGGFSIEVPSKQFFNKTVGLCGNCNFQVDDELTNTNGFIVEKKDFVCNWLEEGDHKACRDSFITEDEPPVVPLCNAVWSSDFSSCHPLLDPSEFVRTCNIEVSHGSDLNNAKCRMLMEYARHCCRIGNVVEGWLEKYGCETKCPPPLEYSYCHDACPQTCKAKHSNLTSECKQVKIDGCRCPEGKVLEDGKCVDEVVCVVCDMEGHKPGDKWDKSPCEHCHCTHEGKVECFQSHCPLPPVCDDDKRLQLIPSKSQSCCKTYVCVQKPEFPCLEPALPSCNEGEVMKIAHSDGPCPIYECVCDPLVCPPISWPSGLEAGQQATLVKDKCCHKVTVACHEKTCPPPPVCGDGLELKNYTGECCITYKCKPPADKCLYVHKYGINQVGIQYETGKTLIRQYMPGSSWDDGLCSKCTCEGNPGQYYPKCVLEQCPNPDLLSADKDYILETRYISNKCCPEIKRLSCKDEDGNVHEKGKEWTSPEDPCKTYRCETDIHGEAQKVTQTIACPTCPKTSQYIYPRPGSGECCGYCQPNACEEGGDIHKVGEKWNSTRRCFNAECVEDQQGVKELYSRISCPSIPENCPKEHLILDETGCCQKCNITLGGCIPVTIPPAETVGMFTVYDIQHGMCTNKQGVQVAVECSGTCESHSFYSLVDGSFKNRCLCCSAKEWKIEKIILDCNDGTVMMKEFKQPTACHCTACSNTKDVSITGQQILQDLPGGQGTKQQISWR